MSNLSGGLTTTTTRYVWSLSACRNAKLNRVSVSPVHLSLTQNSALKSGRKEREREGQVGISWNGATGGRNPLKNTRSPKIDVHGCSFPANIRTLCLPCRNECCCFCSFTSICCQIRLTEDGPITIYTLLLFPFTCKQSTVGHVPFLLAVLLGAFKRDNLLLANLTQLLAAFLFKPCNPLSVFLVVYVSFLRPIRY